MILFITKSGHYLDVFHGSVSLWEINEAKIQEVWVTKLKPSYD